MISKILDRKNEKRILFLSYILCAVVLYYTQSKYFAGPFITLDEPTYFQLSKSIFENFSFLNHMQYYPLYPLVISLSFITESTVKAYEVIKIINILVYVFVIFPLFFICKKLFTKKVICYILPIVLIFLPQRVLISLVWAEPLYYTLLGFTLLFFMNFIENKSKNNAIFLGVSLGCFYLTKPIGIILFIACFLSLIIEYIFWDNKKEKKNYLFVLFVFAIFFIFWSARNLINGSLFGYESETSLLTVSIYNFIDYIKAVFYQLTYFFTASYFIFTALFFCALFNLTNLEKDVRPLVLIVLLYEMGIVAISGVHRIQSINIPYGRYTSAILPYVIIIAIYFINNQVNSMEIKNIVFTTILSIIMLIMTIIYSPLPASLYSYGFLNNFDLAIWNIFLNKGSLTYEPQNVNVVVLPVILFLYSIIFYLLKSKKVKYGICISVFVLMVTSGFVDTSYIKKLSNNTRKLNYLCRYVVENSIPKDRLYLDSNANIDTSFVDVWLGGDYKSIDYKKVSEQNIKIDFGSAESPIEEGCYAVQAPWIGAALYRDDIGIGFDPENLEDLHGTATVAECDLGLNDVVFGSETSDFYIKKAPGKYNVKLSYNFDNFQDLDFEFDIVVNGEYIATVNNDTKDLNFTVNVKEYEELIDFKLIPKGENKCWALMLLEINSDKQMESIKDAYIISNYIYPNCDVVYSEDLLYLLYIK